MGFAVEISKDDIAFTSKFPWKLGIVFNMAYPSLQSSEEDLEKAASFLTQDGFFDRIEIHKISDEGWRKIKKYFQNLDIVRAFQLEVIAQGNNVNAHDEQKRKDAVNYFKGQIDIAVKRGIRKFAICSGQITQDVERDKKQLIASLKEISAHAKKYGATVILETFDTDKDKKLIMGPIDQSAKLVKEVRKTCDNLFLLWDQGHAPLLGETPDSIREYLELLGAVHIGCGIRVQEGLKDWHPVYHTVGAINEEKDLAHLFRVLSEIKYHGPVTLEVKPQQGQTPEEVVNSAKGAIYTSYVLFLRNC